jgi:hypothetical protein
MAAWRNLVEDAGVEEATAGAPGTLALVEEPTHRLRLVPFVPQRLVLVTTTRTTVITSANLFNNFLRNPVVICTVLIISLFIWLN